MSKLKDRGKRKRTVKIGAKGKVIKTKKTLEELNKNVTGAKRAREKEEWEKEKKKTIPKLETKKPTPIDVSTGEKKIIKKKKPIWQSVKKKKKKKKKLMIKSTLKAIPANIEGKSATVQYGYTATSKPLKKR